MSPVPRTILRPFECASTFGAGVRAASALASAFHAEVLAVHVASDGAGTTEASVAPHWGAHAGRESRGRRASWGPEHPTAVPGPFVRAVRELVPRAGIDLIVIDAATLTGRHSAVVRTTLDLIRATSCSVYHLPSPLRGDLALEGPPRRVLCAIDFSAVSMVMFAHAATWANATQASVTLLHVVEEFGGSAIAPFSPLAIGACAEAHAEARGNLVDLVSTGWTAGETPAIVIRDGDAARQIVAVSQERRVDTIMLGARTRTPFGTLLFGSLVSDVLSAAACPVLLAR